MPTPNKCPRALRERAVRMVAEINEPGAIRRVGDKLGVNPETVRYRVNNAPAEMGGKSGLSDAELEELMTLRKEVKGLRRANEILKSASAFFARELDRSRTR